MITVNDPVPPSWHSRLFELVHGETEEAQPGHVELANVLWEMGILPDIRVLRTHAGQPIDEIVAPTREAAIARALIAYRPQWSFWPLGSQRRAASHDPVSSATAKRCNILKKRRRPQQRPGPWSSRTAR